MAASESDDEPNQEIVVNTNPSAEIDPFPIGIEPAESGARSPEQLAELTVPGAGEPDIAEDWREWSSYPVYDVPEVYPEPNPADFEDVDE